MVTWDNLGLVIDALSDEVATRMHSITMPTARSPIACVSVATRCHEQGVPQVNKFKHVFSKGPELGWGPCTEGPGIHRKLFRENSNISSLNEGENPYDFFPLNQRPASTKIYSSTWPAINVKKCDW